MKVLHLPTNIASQMSVTVRALSAIGISVRGLVRHNAVIQSGAGLEIFEIPPRRKNPIAGSIATIKWWKAVYQAIDWADVIHWHFGDSALPFDFDLKAIARKNKVSLIEFWGSDIRVPELASQDNKYMAEMYQKYPQLGDGAAERSQKLQEKFSSYGFTCVVSGLEMIPYVNRKLFPSYILSKQRMFVSEFEPKYPDSKNKRPLVVHAPSNKKGKGTEAVLAAVGSLNAKHSFDFKLIHGLPRSEALKIISNCDIMLDQFNGGDHGLAALEAMAMGKPTVCYIKPSVAAQHLPELPIVNASRDDLSEKLDMLLSDPQMRNDIGQASRAYVEKHHDAIKLAHELVALYQQLLDERKSN